MCILGLSQNLLCFRNDGSFVVHNVPSGSYVVEVVSPTYMFEPLRVDISSRGSMRARKLNNLKPSSVSLLKYPLDFKPLGITRYFQVREKFSIFDLLKSPMVRFPKFCNIYATVLVHYAVKRISDL